MKKNNNNSKVIAFFAVERNCRIIQAITVVILLIICQMIGNAVFNYFSNYDEYTADVYAEYQKKADECLDNITKSNKVIMDFSRLDENMIISMHQQSEYNIIFIEYIESEKQYATNRIFNITITLSKDWQNIENKSIYVVSEEEQKQNEKSKIMQNSIGMTSIFACILIIGTRIIAKKIYENCHKKHKQQIMREWY